MQQIDNMPIEEYHALPRLSASGIKQLLVSSQDFYQTSWMNKSRKERDTESLNVGQAYHCYVLEGVDVFKSRYAVKPDCDRRTKEGKQIYADFLAQYPNAKEIEQELFDEILKAKAAVSGGKPEITFLWEDEETNVPMKARIDYLMPTKIHELKTFSNSGMDIDRLLAMHIVKYRYHVQYAVYTSILPNHDFEFIFQQTGGINNCIVKPFPHNLLLAEQGRKLMRQGINKFRDMYMKYGENEWFDEYQSQPFTDQCFPMYSYE